MQRQSSSATKPPQPTTRPPATGRRTSLSQVISKTSEMSAAPRIKVPTTMLPQQHDDPSAAVAIQVPLLPESQCRTRTKRKTVDTSSSSGCENNVSTRPWKPTAMRDDSVLSYASGEAWEGVYVDPVSGNIRRNIRAEREGVFRASGVLMGVRFVVGLF